MGADFDWNLPKGFPRPIVPADNPMSAAKVELGRYLFYDKRISVNGKESCGTCHRLGRKERVACSIRAAV
jgi:cytochrome c peroxidase